MISNFSDERKSRLEDSLTRFSQQNDTLRAIAYRALEDANCKEKLVEIVLNERWDAVMEMTGIREKHETEKLRLEDEKERLKNEIAILRKTEEELRNTALEAKKNELGEIQSSIIEAEEKFSRISEKLRVATDIESLNQDKTKAEQDYNAVVRLNNEQNRIQNELEKAITDHTAILGKAIDKKVLDRILREADNVDDDHAPPEIFDQTLWEPSGNNDDARARSIVDRVQNVMQNAGRHLAYNDILNYLICITQGFITTFAGEPGSGKTSLCNLLAYSLGLARTDIHNRFVEIAVERGWTSHKDFSGYYNPLSKRMERSNQAVFDALKQLDDEYGKNEIAPYFFLLDEANLSPIEHYWAAFLRNCDFDSSHKRSVNMGGKTVYKIPAHLRFLATVNFDHTTEELSPRFIDRSWIIILPPQRAVNDSHINQYPDSELGIVNYASLDRLFGVSKDQQEDTLLEKTWGSVLKTFESANLPVFPRNVKMVRQYFRTACQYMDTKDQNNRFAPLDYAIAQKVLPTINGSGKRFEKLVGDLSAVCTGLPLCSEHLKRIKDDAERNMGFFQFFTR